MHRPSRPACPCADRECPWGPARWRVRSIPFERSLLPFIDKADRQDRKEQNECPKAETAKLLAGHRIGNEQVKLDVEDDEENSDQIEPDVELHPRVIEGVETTFIGGELFRVRLLVGDDE